MWNRYGDQRWEPEAIGQLPTIATRKVKRGVLV
jgi:hypothetical protein